MQLEGDAEHLSWLPGCLVGEVSELETITHILKIFVEEGFSDFLIRYIGGLRVLVEVGSPQKVEMLLKQIMEWLLQWF